jgi:UDP-N-acetylmuramate--alanine ligase
MTASLDDAKRIHFIGIGGCSMSGIARILKAQGHEVTGSDRGHTQFTDRLEEDGITVYYGHSAEQVGNADLIVYSAAIKPENPERVYGREHGIPELERSVALGQLSARFHEVVAVAGCHGKTTITSMLAFVNEEANLDATVHVGGFMDLLGGGVRLGKSDLFITEACEYVESFLTLRPTIAIVNNIDDDHLDYYGDIAHIVAAFRKFLALVPKSGRILACTDDVYVRELLPELGDNVITYGLNKGDIHADRIAFDEMGFPSFDLYDHGEMIGRVALHVPGRHNVINALAVYGASKLCGVTFEQYAAAMARFRNTSRRFELLGEKNGVKVFHDYGHHPNEIRETLAAATHVPHNRIFCVFQCNSYTRARTLFCEHVTCFADADEVLVPDIYPGREVDTGIVHARDMVAGINRATHNALYLGTFEKIAAYLDEHAVPGDIVITVGSGDVYRQSQKLL